MGVSAFHTRVEGRSAMAGLEQPGHTCRCTYREL